MFVSCREISAGTFAWSAMVEILAALPVTAQHQLGDLRNLLLRWNLRFNLTAVNDPGEVDRRLIGDSLQMLPAIDDAIRAWRAGNRRHAIDPDKPAALRLIDIGSG